MFGALGYGAVDLHVVLEVLTLWVPMGVDISGHYISLMI